MTRGRLLGSIMMTLACGAPALVHASIVISTDPTKNVTCSAGVCSATAADAVLNVSDLTNLLASGDLTVKSGSQAANIAVSATFSWVSDSRLTLDAFRSILFQQTVVVAGKGALTILTNDGGSGGDFRFLQKGRVEFWDLKSKLVIGGHAYVLVKNIKQLAAKAAGNPAGFFALNRPDKASKDGAYPASPVATAFSGTFEGLGNPFAGLTITDTAGPANLGLFAQLATGGVVRDVKLTKVNINAEATGAIGALVGDNHGTVLNSSVSGTVVDTANDSIVCAGALVGNNESGATISGSSSTASLQLNTLPGAYAGGFAGCNGGTIENSSAKANVTGYGSSDTGGFVGRNLAGAMIASSSAGGNLSNGLFEDGILGGFAGYNEGTIQGSSATGNVTSGGYLGGFAGENDATITTSFATGSVTLTTSSNSGGGLVALNSGTISQSYATGTVAGSSQMFIGGIAGHNDGTVEDCYAEGAVMGVDETSAGGLIGENLGFVQRDYSTGAVEGGSGETGGSVGTDNSSGGKFASDYWDLNTSGISNKSQGAGNFPNDPGIVGLTTTQLQSGLPSGFSAAVWGQNASINKGFPYLLALPPEK